jgi:hypothetical protein
MGARSGGRWPTIAAARRSCSGHATRVHAELAAPTRNRALAEVPDAPDPAKVWATLDLERRRAVIQVLIEEVVILPVARKGRRAGWRRGDSYFDPDSVRITPARLSGWLLTWRGYGGVLHDGGAGGNLEANRRDHGAANIEGNLVRIIDLDPALVTLNGDLPDRQVGRDEGVVIEVIE